MDTDLIMVLLDIGNFVAVSMATIWVITTIETMYKDFWKVRKNKKCQNQR